MGHLLVVNILLKCDNIQLLITKLNWWFYTKGFQKLFKTLKKGAPLKVLTSIPLEITLPGKILLCPINWDIGNKLHGH